MADKITIEFDNRDEVAMLYTASFFITNDQSPIPGHPPTPAQTAQLKLAEALDEDMPEAALQDFERQLSSARQSAQRRAAQFEQVRSSKAHAARARQPGRREDS
jgi:hypothetical protein